MKLAYDASEVLDQRREDALVRPYVFEESLSCGPSAS
jgi:hypothetical protein